MGEQTNPIVEMATSKGSMRVELLLDQAPRTVNNFLKYVDDGFYDGTIFHRVIEDFMVQGGGFTEQMDQKPTLEPVQNEADNGLLNAQGTLAMARTSDPHSATAQFFINASDRNSFLDHQSKTPQGWGYCVFGKVVEGLDVVDQIRSVETCTRGGHQDVPVESVVINTVKRV